MVPPRMAHQGRGRVRIQALGGLLGSTLGLSPAYGAEAAAWTLSGGETGWLIFSLIAVVAATAFGLLVRPRKTIVVAPSLPPAPSPAPVDPDETRDLLTAGIAHDLANVLQTVQTYGALLDDSELPADLRADLSALREASQVGTELSRRLLAVYRGRSHEPHTLSLSEQLVALHGVLATLARPSALALLPPTVGSERFLTVIDPLELEQILINLVVNARQAGASRIDVGVYRGWSHRSVPVDGGRLPPGDWLRLEVTDDGVGISPSELPRVTDAYHSTRAGGNGIGLAVVQMHAERAGGGLQVSSSVGHGTTVAVYLPSKPQPKLVPQPPPSSDSSDAPPLPLPSESN